MAAAAFKGVLKFQAQNGVTFSYNCAMTDVAAAGWTFPDGSSDVVLPSIYGNLFLVDVVLSAAGTDCSKSDLYVNGKTTGEQVLHSANLGTNFSRQLMGAPIAIMPGARLKIVQAT